MKKLISLICLLTLVLSLAAPTQLIASAAPVDVGAATMVIDGVTYVSETDDGVNAKAIRGPFNFEDADGNPMMHEELATGKNFYQDTDATKQAASYGVIDFADHPVNSALDENERDPDNHKGVFQHKTPMNVAYKSMYLTTNGTFSNTAGVSVMNFDVFYTGAPLAGASALTFYVKDESDSTKYIQLYTRAAEGGKVKYVYQTKYNQADGEVDVGIVEPGKWYNMTFMLDITNDTISILFDGEPKLMNATFAHSDGVSFKIKQVIRSFIYSRSNNDVLWDNFSYYVYYAQYDVTGVKGVDGDELTELVSYENGSKIAVQFNTGMKASEFAGDVTVRLKDGADVAIEDITEADYDAATKTLYITTKEALKPGAEYEVILKGNTTDSSGEPVYGVVSADNMGYDEDKIFEFTTAESPYGVDDVALSGAITAGATVDATVTLRTDLAEDANLVMVLYADGKMRSISSAAIDADALEASYTLPINVPADGSDYKVCALLLDANYGVIDIIDVE